MKDQLFNAQMNPSLFKQNSKLSICHSRQPILHPKKTNANMIWGGRWKLKSTTDRNLLDMPSGKESELEESDFIFGRKSESSSVCNVRGWRRLDGKRSWFRTWQAAIADTLVSAPSKQRETDYINWDVR